MNAPVILGFKHPKGYLPYDGGLLIVYGQNGAGKSLLLESIESSLTGRRTKRTPDNYFENWLPVPSGVIVRSRLDQLATRFGFEGLDDDFGDRLGAALLDAHAFISEPVIPASIVRAWRAVSAEFARQDVAIMAPSGTQEARWIARLTTEPGSPSASAWCDAIDARVAEVSAEHGSTDPRDHNLWISELDEEAVLLAHVSGLNGLADDSILRFNGVSQLLTSQPFGRVITDVSAEPSDLVRRWIERSLWSGGETGVVPDPAEILARLEPAAHGWALRANDLFTQFLLDPPTLRIDLGSPSSWISGVGPHWLSSSGVPIESLSDAERRWARIAIALALPGEDQTPWFSSADEPQFSIDEGSDLPTPFLLLDEPERGLHRAAEEHLARNLLALTSRGRIKPIIATHSAALLDSASGQVIHIRKPAEDSEGGIGVLSQITPREAADLRELGLAPSSLLNLDRGYLLVEGVQDRAILEGWFDEELRAMRVTILPMHGTRNLLTVLDTEFLISGTQALLIPLLDDVAREGLLSMWAEVEAKVAHGKRSDAFGLVMRKMGNLKGGAEDYGTLLASAIERGVSGRFFPLGMAKKDVLEYLPVEHLVPEATSWEALRSEYLSRRPSPAAMANRGPRSAGKQYKDWLKSRGADLSSENLRWIAEGTAPHPELKGAIAAVSERLDQKTPKR